MQSQINPQAQKCLQKLMLIWLDFERQLNQVPIVQRLDSGSFNCTDYKKLLLNLRQQVVEGSRWITRCASSFDRNFSDVRSIIIGHAKDEHRDYQMLESDYVALGGDIVDIQMKGRNIGTEALHGFLMYRASQLNPNDLLGAMWIIENLGNKMSSDWAERIEQLLDRKNIPTHFLRYHGENDEEHIGKLYQLLDRLCVKEEDFLRITQTARVVARLYVLQLELIDEE